MKQDAQARIRNGNRISLRFEIDSPLILALPMGPISLHVINKHMNRSLVGHHWMHKKVRQYVSLMLLLVFEVHA